MTVITYHKVKAALHSRNILITGTTGFIGKVFLEKILRTCQDVGCLYVVVRNNGKHLDAKSRFVAEVLGSSLFDRIKATQPDLLSKIEVVDGELTEPNLGMSPADFDKLGSKMHLIVNCAASVNFREALDKAIKINTQSLFSQVSLAKTKDIPFLQVSTCYVHGYHSGVMKEELHVPYGGTLKPDAHGHYDVEGILTGFQRSIDKTLQDCMTPDEREPRLVDLGIRTANALGWNDTYTMTKWLGEAYLHKALQGKTLTILRPAIVESCLEDPAPGWIEGVKVADAVVLAYARQKAVFMPGNKNSIVDVIPVDLVVNAMVLASAEALLKHGTTKIYQVGSSSTNPITMDRFHRILEDNCLANWRKYDRLFYAEPKKRFRLVNRTLFNFALKLMSVYLNVARTLRPGKATQKAFDSFQTTRSLATVFGFYMASTYTFDTSALKQLVDGYGSYADDFPVDARRIKWTEYMGDNHLAGLNRYSMKPRKPVKQESPATESHRSAA